MRRLLLLLTTMAIPALCLAADKTNIAVTDLVAQGTDNATSAVISDRFRAELINTGIFRVMERAQMESVLKEQGFQKSGACSDNECIVEVGQLLGVTHMVAGTVGKLDNLYSISVRAIDVSSGEILFVTSEDCECPVKVVISETLKKVAQTIAQKMTDLTEKKSMVGATGDLFISSTPPGGTVRIDGAVVDGTTPLTLKKFASGEHTIAVEKDGLVAVRTVTLKADDLLNVELALEKGRARLKVFSDPAGAEVLLDGSSMGRTPLKLDQVASGSHELILRKETYLPASTALIFAANVSQEISQSLRPCGYLTITTTPATARIVLNGTDTVTSGTVVPLAPGPVHMTVTAPDCDPMSKDLVMAHGLRLAETVQLRSVFSSMTVRSTPDSARVTLNGKEQSATPLVLTRLEPGMYSVVIHRDTYSDSKHDLTLVKGETRVINATLQHTPEYLQARKRSRARGLWTARALVAAGAAGFLAAGIYYNNQYDKFYDTYAAINTPGNHSSAFDESHSKMVVRNVMYSVSGAFACGLAVTFLIR